MLEIPEFYKKLLNSPGIATLSVLGRDGSIQSTLVWPDFDGEFIKINMTEGSPKERNIQREKKATILVSHASNENLYISIRCEFHKVTKEGAIEHIDMMTRRNMNALKWFGDVEPEDSKSKERTVIVYLKPVRVFYSE
ncbi:MAG: hypothetical protein ACI9SC_001784 [Gammaproteobacteria bacterium]|jgi:hypothetical protein